MNKVALAEEINKVLNTSKAEAERVVEALFDSIISSLKRGEEVSVAGFGKFSVKMRKAREARNPKTGETVKVPASNAVKFSVAKALKEGVK